MSRICAELKQDVLKNIPIPEVVSLWGYKVANIKFRGCKKRQYGKCFFVISNFKTAYPKGMTIYDPASHLFR